MVEYAINDVRYILALADELLGRLRRLKRLAWFQQSCAAARSMVLQRPAPDTEESWRITGWGNLQPQGTGRAAGALALAQRRGRAARPPAFKVINNEPLLQMATQFQEGGRPELPPRFPAPAAPSVSPGARSRRKLPPDQWPKRRLPKKGSRHPEAEPRFDHLKHHRDRIAQELDLDGALIASRGTMEEIAHDAVAASQLMEWQRVLMQPAIECLAQLPPAANGRRARRERPKYSDEAKPQIVEGR